MLRRVSESICWVAPSSAVKSKCGMCGAVVIARFLRLDQRPKQIRSSLFQCQLASSQGAEPQFNIAAGPWTRKKVTQFVDRPSNFPPMFWSFQPLPSSFCFPREGIHSRVKLLVYICGRTGPSASSGEWQISWVEWVSTNREANGQNEFTYLPMIYIDLPYFGH